MTTTANSLEAYHKTIESGLISNLQKVVLRTLGEAPEPLTASEIARKAYKEKSIITPRLRELELMNVLKKGIARKCSITGHNASPYLFTGQEPRKLLRDSTKCPLCHGAGKVPVE